MFQFSTPTSGLLFTVTTTSWRMSSMRKIWRWKKCNQLHPPNLRKTAYHFHEMIKTWGHLIKLKYISCRASNSGVPRILIHFVTAAKKRCGGCLLSKVPYRHWSHFLRRQCSEMELYLSEFTMYSHYVGLRESWISWWTSRVRQSLLKYSPIYSETSLELTKKVRTQSLVSSIGVHLQSLSFTDMMQIRLTHPLARR